MKKTVFNHIRYQKAYRFTRSALKALQQIKKSFHVNEQKSFEHFCSVPFHVRFCRLPKPLEDLTLEMNNCSKTFLKKRVIVDSEKPTVTLFVKNKGAPHGKGVQRNKINANSDATNSGSNADVIEIPDDSLLLESIDSEDDDVVIVEPSVINLDDTIISVDSQASQEPDNANNNESKCVNIKMEDTEDIIFVKEEIPTEKKLINTADFVIKQGTTSKMQAHVSNPVKHVELNQNKVKKKKIRRLNRKLTKVVSKCAHKHLRRIGNRSVPSSNRQNSNSPNLIPFTLAVHAPPNNPNVSSSNRQNSNFPNLLPFTNTVHATPNNPNVPSSIRQNSNLPNLFSFTNTVHAAPNNPNLSLSFMDFQNNMCSIIPKKKSGLREIVIDGSNIAMGHSNNRFFSVKGLQIAIEYFVKKGHKVVALVPHFRKKFNQTSDPMLLRKLEEKGLVVFTPSREVNGKRITPYDDRYILQYASACEGIVVSGDNYRDLFVEKPEWRETIEKRLLMPTWIRDCLIFPEDPLGRTGPTLNAFLKFPE